MRKPAVSSISSCGSSDPAISTPCPSCSRQKRGSRSMREEKFSDRLYDVAIIGGGINGASAAQHLAAAGYDVLLVEKGDFGSGSTSRSSRLLHCGLRYLAPGASMWDFVLRPRTLAIAMRMARQAMQCRAQMIETAPERTQKAKFA